MYISVDYGFHVNADAIFIVLEFFFFILIAFDVTLRKILYLGKRRKVGWMRKKSSLKSSQHENFFFLSFFKNLFSTPLRRIKKLRIWRKKKRYYNFFTTYMYEYFFSCCFLWVNLIQLYEKFCTREFHQSACAPSLSHSLVNSIDTRQKTTTTMMTTTMVFFRMRGILIFFSSLLQFYFLR